MNISFPQKNTFDTLTANTLVCPTIQSGIGNLELFSGVAGGLTVAGANMFANYHIKLAVNQELQDNSGNTLIAGDNSGNLDQLARLDCALVNPDLNDFINIKPISALISGGGITSEVGLYSNATETIVLSLSSFIQSRQLNAYNKIKTITLRGTTGHVNNYITELRLSSSVDTETLTTLDTRSADIGNGSTGFFNITETLTTARKVSDDLFLEIDNVYASVDGTHISTLILGLVRDTTN